MYLVFGWRAGLPSGGLNDLLKRFDSMDDAVAFVDSLEASGEDWDTQIVTKVDLEIIAESANTLCVEVPNGELILH